MVGKALLLGVDGGGTGCRARLADLEGPYLRRGRGRAGQHPLRPQGELSRGVAGGRRVPGPGRRCRSTRPTSSPAWRSPAPASRPTLRQRAPTHLPFRHAIITTDAHAACVGAHGGRGRRHHHRRHRQRRLGGRRRRASYRVGGWGFPVSDEGSGAWLGCEAVRRVLWAYDGRMAWTGLLTKVIAALRRRSARHRALDGHRHVRATLRRLAPLVRGVCCARRCRGERAHARSRPPTSTPSPRGWCSSGVPRLALTGGIAERHRAVARPRRHAQHLVTPHGDASSGALQMARQEAETMTLAPTQAAI